MPSSRNGLITIWCDTEYLARAGLSAAAETSVGYSGCGLKSSENVPHLINTGCPFYNTPHVSALVFTTYVTVASLSRCWNCIPQRQVDESTLGWRSQHGSDGTPVTNGRSHWPTVAALFLGCTRHTSPITQRDWLPVLSKPFRGMLFLAPPTSPLSVAPEKYRVYKPTALLVPHKTITNMKI